MKKLNGIAAISLTVLLASAPAFAESGTSSSDMSPSQSWQNAKNAVKTTYRKIKAAVINNEANSSPVAVTIDERMTAKGMIGKTAYNENDRRVGTIHDIILDNDGTARLIVVSNGTFPGLKGKLAAFSYDSIINRTKNGDVVMPLTQKSINSAVEFSYNAATGGNVRGIPENGYSVANLLKGKILGDDNSKLANIDNLSFRDGRAALVIAAYNQIFGMGGKKAAVAFKGASFVRENNQVNLKLSAAETQNFRDYKKMSEGKKVSSND